MDDTSNPEIDSQWLIKLRWISASAQLALICFVPIFLNISLPILPLSFLLAVLVLSNVGLQRLVSAERAISLNYLASVLLLDTALLYLLLLMTGGPFNPFSTLFIVHIALAAVLLGPRWTWLIAVLSSVCFGALFVWHRPLGEAVQHAHHGSFSLHLYGMFLAFILTSFLVAYFVSRVASQLQEKQEELRLVERERFNQVRLQSLATLAAGAAHELASPLSTIAVAAGELLREVPAGSSAAEDVGLIRNEIKRCSNVIDQIGASGGALKGELPEVVVASEAVYDAISELTSEQRARLLIEVDCDSSVLLSPTGLKHTLLALIRNALDASPLERIVVVSAYQNRDASVFAVSDKGPGIAPGVFERLGEPFYTTKEAGQGMGLGIFLSKSFVSQYGGELSFNTQTAVGTTAVLSFPMYRKVAGF